jgi:hypothetical protein
MTASPRLFMFSRAEWIATSGLLALLVTVVIITLGPLDSWARLLFPVAHAHQALHDIRLVTLYGYEDDGGPTAEVVAWRHLMASSQPRGEFDRALAGAKTPAALFLAAVGAAATDDAHRESIAGRLATRIGSDSIPVLATEVHDVVYHDSAWARRAVASGGIAGFLLGVDLREHHCW